MENLGSKLALGIIVLTIGILLSAPVQSVLRTCDPPAISADVVLGSNSTQFDIGYQLSLSCASTQHHIDGNSTLMCQDVEGQANGVWSAAPPTCVTNTCDPPEVSTGVALGSTSTEFSIGDQLSLSCASAQHHVDGETTLICQNVEGQVQGVWSANPPTCVPNTCDPPTVINDVAFNSSSTEFSIGDQLSFSCASVQYHMDGETTLMCQNVEGQAKGVWSAAPPTCLPITCDPPVVNTGVALGSTSTEFSIGDQLSLFCASTQYHMDGETTLTCQNVEGQAKGAWSAAPPICVPNTCDPPAVSTGVTLGSNSTEFSIGNQLAFACASPQHHMPGENTLTCQNVEGHTQGVWSAAPPICVLNTCDPPALSNGVVFNSTSTKFNIGEQLAFSCASAYHHMDGETTLICQNVEGQATGVWSAAPPTCGPFPYCPENWDSFGKHCYLVNTAETSFNSARADCQRLGSNLTSIGNAEEHMFHKRLVLQAGVSLWIGLHDVANEEHFEWIDGSPFNFESWNAGEPNDWRLSAQEDCVHLIARNGHWNDMPCSNEVGFICKQLRATRDGFCPPEVTYSTRGFMTWQESPVGQTSFSKETCDVNTFNSGRSIGVRYCSSEYNQCTRDQPGLDIYLSGKRTRQASTAYEGSSDRAVDGNTNGLWDGRSCTHTSTQRNPWWFVDLVTPTCIDHVVLFNREDVRDAEALPGCELTSKEGKWSQVDDIPCDNVVTEYVPARCQSQLGMEDRRIQDSQITVSSMYNTKHAGHQGRLNYVAPSSSHSCSWCSLVKDRDQWIQVDLFHRTSVTGVILQGRDSSTPPCGNYPRWVTKFKVQYGQNGRQWNNVKDGNNNAEMFDGNTDTTTPVTRYFHTPVVARFIRIQPWEWSQSICMRFELLGCQECPASWDVNGDYCYYVNTDRMTFSDAQSECQRLDSNLTSIHNADEQIYHTLQAKAANEYLWIGLHDRVGEQSFTWVDGTEDNDDFQPPWAPFQPDNGDNDGEDCVHLRSGRDAGLWADLPCTSSAGYICKRPKVRRDGMCPAMVTSFHRQIEGRHYLTWENSLAGEIAFSDEVCPDDSPNAAGLPIAMRVCSETSEWANDILLNCFKDEIEPTLAPVLSAIMPTCAPEQTNSDNGITLHWSETEVGDSTFSNELCPNTTEHAGRPIAYRSCDQDYYAATNNTQGLWQPVKMLGCHGTIYNTTVLTESDMDAVSSKLLHFTRSMRSANMNDIHAVAWMIKNIASMESSSNQVLESVTQAINTLVEVVDPAVRLEPYDETLATSTSDMVLALEKQVAATMEEKDKVSIVESSLAIVGIRLFANDHLRELHFTTYQASDDLNARRFSTYQDDHQLHDNPFAFIYASAASLVDNTNDVFRTMEEEEQTLAASIQIPSIALEIETNSSKYVGFISYGDDFLFPSYRLATEGMMVDAPVVTTTLTASNLTEPVRIRFRVRSDEANDVNSNTIEPSEGMSESSHRCVFWDDQLHGGVGDWSDNGCEVAGTVDALRTVTCHCYHLSTFAVLSTDISHQYERQSAVLPVASKSAISFISLVPVVMTLIILLGFRKLRETRAYHTLCNFTVAILVLQVIFAAGIDNTDSSVGCILVASLFQYFTLVSFLWLAADIRFDYGACKTPSSDTASHIQTAALMKAYAISWGTPVVVVGVTLAISFHDYVNTNFCAVTLSPALFYGTVIPVALIVLHNLFIHASYAFVTLKKPPSVDGQLEVHRSSQRLKAASIVSVALLFTLCLAYLFLANPDVVVMRALYGISEVFMSVLIFCMFCLYLDEVCEMVIPKKYRRHQDDAPEHDNFINPSYELDDNPCSEKAMIKA